MNIRAILNVILILFLFSFQAESQSVYKTGGLGLFENQIYVRSRGMGGVSFSMKDEIGVNLSNPALWSSLPGASVTGFFISRQSRSDSLGKTVLDSDFGGFTFYFPVKQKYGFAMGLLPYSEQYSFSSVNDTLLSGDVSYPVRYDLYSRGGASLAFIGLGGPVYNNVSLGLRIDFLFSNLMEKRKTLFTNTGEGSILYKMIGFSGVRFHLGWYLELSYKYSLGGSLILPGRTKTTMTLDYRRGSDVKQNLKSSPIPWEANLGTAIRLNKRNTLGMEINASFFEKDYLKKLDLLENREIKSSYTFRTGYERDATGKNEGEWYNQFIYRMGVYYKLQYISGDKERMIEEGVTAGIGLPFQKRMNRVDFALTLGRRDGYLGGENFLRFTLNFISNEKWFIRGRKL